MHTKRTGTLTAGTSPLRMSPMSAVVASVAVAMMDPTYDSKRSAPMPATSPTLSPTLSAITAGLRGSSSGMAFSTFPTRSAPTSAALVYTPPPTRANSAIDDAPKPKPARKVHASSSKPEKMAQRMASPRIPKPVTVRPMHAPARKAISSPDCKLTRHASVVRTLALVAMYMPKYPAAPDRRAPVRKQMTE